MTVENSITVPEKSAHKYRSSCRFFISIHNNKLNVFERRILNDHQSQPEEKTILKIPIRKKSITVQMLLAN